MFEELGGAPSTHNFIIGMDGMSQTAEANKGITPVFYREPILNPSRTAKEGRPIYDDMEVVRIFVAGDPLNQIVKPVDASMKERFPVQYDAWIKKQEGMTISGTPIRQWPLLTPANIAEFEGLKIFSVEALSEVSDGNVTKSVGLREWREKAKAWLETNKDSSAAARYASENMRLSDEVAELKQQMKDLSDQVMSMSMKKAKA
jgi:hypothetical protein